MLDYVVFFLLARFIYCTFIILYGLQFPQSSSVIFFVPQVIDYCIDAETVKILGDAKIWNSLLIKNNKELLAGVDGLSEIKFDPICEAVDKLMVSLKNVFASSLFFVFGQNTVTTMCFVSGFTNLPSSSLHSDGFT